MALPGELTSQSALHTRAHSLDFDVKAFFGAAWDGATNDSVKVQDAIDAAFAAGGGRVRLPRGEGRANVTLKPRVFLVGEGVGVTTMKSVAGSNADVVKGLNFATLTGKSYAAGDYALGCYSAGVENMTIDGNKANQVGGYGLRLWGRELRIKDVIVQNCDNDGIWTEFTDVDNFGDPAQVLEGVFGDITVQNNGGNGWTFRGPHDSVCKGAFNAYSNGGWALRNEQSAGSYIGGITIDTANSFLNAHSFYANCYLGLRAGTASAANTGIGIQLESDAGGSKLIGVGVAGHTTGLLLKAQNCVIDVWFINNPGDCIEYGTGVGWNTIRFNGANNTNGIKHAVNETGPQIVTGVLNCSGAQTLNTGAGTIASTSSYNVIASGAADVTKYFKLSTDTLFNSNGYSPKLPASDLTMVAPDVASVFQALQTFVTGNLAVGSAKFYSGTGSPETVVTAAVGSMYLRTDGGAATTLYIKESGAGNTGWIAK